MMFLSSSPFIILITFWIYFFAYSYRHKINFPWGFGIVIMGLLLDGSITQDRDDTTVSSINLMLVICLIGLFWNINNIKEQFHIRDRRGLIRFIGIGLVIGLLFGFAMQIPQEVKNSPISGQYTTLALIAAVVQWSVAEEFLITGYFLGYLKKHGVNQFFAVTIQSLFFTFLHVPRYSSDWIRLLIVYLGAVVSGSLALKSNNLFPSFVLHITINLIAVYWRLNIF